MEHISKSFNESYSPDRMDESQFPDWTIEEFDAIRKIMHFRRAIAGLCVRRLKNTGERPDAAFHFLLRFQQPLPVRCCPSVFMRR